MARRQMVVKPRLAALVLLPLLASCSLHETLHTTPEAHATPKARGTSLSPDEVTKAETIARSVIADQGASVSSASVLARSGRVKDSNTGHPCTSGRELQIKLIGKFPHTVTTGHAVPPASPTPPFPLRAMIITADAAPGRACLIGVQTGETARSSRCPVQRTCRSVSRTNALT